MAVLDGDALTDVASYPLLRAFPHPLLFVTISGSHLYGFSSADSDVDLRGTHAVPTERILGLEPPPGTIDVMGEGDNPEDLVSQEIAKFCAIAIKNAPHALEQILSPLVVMTSPWHDELRAIVPTCVVRRHVGHYLGFTNSQLSILRRQPGKTVKVVLYLFRSVMSGIVFARTGRIEANLRVLNDEFRFDYIDELIAQKTGGRERDEFTSSHALDFYLREHARLAADLEVACAASKLPETAAAGVAELDAFLLRVRRANYAA